MLIFSSVNILDNTIIFNLSYNGIDVSVWQGLNIDFNKVEKMERISSSLEPDVVIAKINTLNQATKTQRCSNMRRCLLVY